MSFDLAARLLPAVPNTFIASAPCWKAPKARKWWWTASRCWRSATTTTWAWPITRKVIEAWRAGAERWGVGGGASHLVVGHATPHHELEEALADLTGRPRALLFTTGYMANLGAVTALVGQGDTVLDRLNHASLLDAGLLSGARFNRYLHNDATAWPSAWRRPPAIRWWSPTACSAWTATRRPAGAGPRNVPKAPG
jgi:8-amino-7-oxononanoate synthase